MALFQDPDEKNLSDLIVLEKTEAIEHHLQIIEAWQPQWEVWPIQHSSAVLAGCSTASCIYINNYYRKKLRLLNYGKISSLIPTIFFPAVFATMGHAVFVQNDILLRETKCSLCIELRSAAIQMFSSVAFPMALAPLAGFSFAIRYRTFVVPDLTKQVGRKYAIETMRKFTTPILSKLLLILAAQGLVGIVLANQELKAVARIDMKFAELEAQEQNEVNL